MKIVPATQELLTEYYGAPPPVTMRAFVLVEDDKPVAVAGFLYRATRERVIFSEARPEVFKHRKLWVMRLAKMLMKIADDNEWTLVADPDKDIQSASKFLEHLGFELQERGEYVRWHSHGQQ